MLILNLTQNFLYFTVLKNLTFYILLRIVRFCSLLSEDDAMCQMTHFPKNQMGNDRGAEFCFDMSRSYTTAHHRDGVFLKHCDTFK